MNGMSLIKKADTMTLHPFEIYLLDVVSILGVIILFLISIDVSEYVSKQKWFKRLF